MKKTALLSRLMLWGVILAAALLSACSTGTNSSSTAPDGSWEKIQRAGELLIGLEDGFAPVSDFDGETARGFAAESALEACRRLGVEAHFVPVSSDDAVDCLEAGEIDCIWAGNKAALLDSNSTELSYTYLHGKQVILYLSSSGVRNIADLQGLAVGVREGSNGNAVLSASTTFRSSLSEVSVYPDIDSLKDALDNGKITAAVVENFCAQPLIKESPETYAIVPDDSGNSPLSIANDDYCAIFRSDDSSLAAQVESVLSGMISDGTLSIYSEKWLGQDAVTKQ